MSTTGVTFVFHTPFDIQEDNPYMIIDAKGTPIMQCIDPLVALSFANEFNTFYEGQDTVEFEHQFYNGDIAEDEEVS